MSVTDLGMAQDQPGDVVPVRKTRRHERGHRPSAAEMEIANRLVAQIKAEGGFGDDPQALLKALTKSVLEGALEEEMTHHVGYSKSSVDGRNGENSRNGKRSKTVLTDSVGRVEIEVPRDRDGTFEPVIVKKRQRRLGSVEDIILSLYARGMTTGDISAHFSEIYDTEVSKNLISDITDRVMSEAAAWRSRPLNAVYAAVFIDAMMVKVRDGQVANKPVYAAIGVDLDGNRDTLGIWMGDGAGESSKFWFAVLTDLKNRGVQDIFFIICDGLKGLPDVVGQVFPQTRVQTCVIHLVRNSMRYVARQHWDALVKDLKRIYLAKDVANAALALDELEQKWGQRHPAMIRSWRNAWEEFIPFLEYDSDIRGVLYSTNAIESLNSRFRRAVKARGHFPTDDAALKCLYLVIRSMDPTGTGKRKWAVRWKAPLNAFAMTFADRMPDSTVN